ncbi:shikimate dehydrogenase [Endozoicomonadaceae bacterium StTr2]
MTATDSDRYAVMGNPIGHSKSPMIHSLFAEQTGQHLGYEAILAEEDGFDEAASCFFIEGGKGLNITVPFKHQALGLAHQLTPRAEKAGAVNTLWYNGEVMHGDNTDGIGLLTDLKQNNQVTIKDKRVLVLGAGGAVRGVLQPLLEEEPGELVIANRTQAKAEQLVAEFCEYKNIVALQFELLRGHFDLIINGTSASLQGAAVPLPDSVVSENTVCYDMMYSAVETPFNRWARENGAGMQLDGLGMLVEQAAEAFYIWRGIRPQTQPVIEKVRTELG